MASSTTPIQRILAHRPPATTIVRVARLRLARQLRRQETESGSSGSPEMSQTDVYLRHSYALIDLLRLAVAERTEGKR